MIITHAILGSGGLAALLVAAVGLMVAAVVVTVSTVRNTRRLSGAEAVPLWWDQATPEPVLRSEGLAEQ